MNSPSDPKELSVGKIETLRRTPRNSEVRSEVITEERHLPKHPTGMTRGKIRTFLLYKCLVFPII